MSSSDPLTPVPEDPRPTVFLSYASEDRAAARVIRDSLPGLGLEPWYDESELGGGEAWDQKIRRQIRACHYFMPLISASTERRAEGYFRREWRMAVERTLDMADDHPFLLPIVIDDTDQSRARVPEKFLTVQWLRLPGGQPTPAFEALCRRINLQQPANRAAVKPAQKSADKAAKFASLPGNGGYPEFPREEPGQRVRFWAQILGWLLMSGWMLFKRLPRWVRWVATIWLVIVLLSTSKHDRSSDIPASTSRKMKEISDKAETLPSTPDVAKIAKQLAREFGDDPDDSPEDGIALLAVPFAEPGGDLKARKRLDAIFAVIYGRLAISHHGQVLLAKDSAPAVDLAAALGRAHVSHSTYVLFGKVDPATSMLAVEIVKVADGSVAWSRSYPMGEADPAAIATEVDAGVPALADK